MADEQARLEELAMAADIPIELVGGHCLRVGKLSGLLACVLGWPPDACEELELAARLHDIGKATIPESILLKAGPLSDEEWKIVREHPDVGAALIENAMPGNHLAASIARYHHENWGGGGYPTGITGDAIPIAARIVSIVDCFDALTHDQVYRKRWSVGQALAEITLQGGIHFDPAMTQPFATTVMRMAVRGLSIDELLGYAPESAAVRRGKTIEKTLDAEASDPGQEP